MIRVDCVELTCKEITRVAANFFLKDGYRKTTFRAMSQVMNMSTGNMTFHFPTKEHMLAGLVDMLGQWIEESIVTIVDGIIHIPLKDGKGLLISKPGADLPSVEDDPEDIPQTGDVFVPVLPVLIICVAILVAITKKKQMMK